MVLYKKAKLILRHREIGPASSAGRLTSGSLGRECDIEAEPKPLSLEEFYLQQMSALRRDCIHACNCAPDYRLNNCSRNGWTIC